MSGDAEAHARRAARERVARKEAERLLEEKSRDLHQANQRLARLASDLEAQVARRTEELQQAVLRAELAARVKGDFLATMSHEIRTPLNGIIGAAELIGSTELDDEQRVYAETLHLCGQMLFALINDILDFSKIEASHLELEARPLDLAAVLRDVAEIHRSTAAAKGVAIDLQLRAASPRLLGDETRLRQVFANLVSNAVKFSERGAVTIALESRPLDGGRWRVQVAVRDHGIGMSAAVVERLFRPFTQADSSTTRRYGGTGLGLAISQRLIAAMGGAIAVDSALGAGSTFTVTVDLPGAPAGDAGRTTRPPPPPDRALRVLLVEDNRVNSDLALHMLRRLEVQADLARDGREAVEMASRTAYDLILMDMQMPVMDGLEATRAIRALPGGTRPRIVAVTANAFAHDRDACLAAGMDAFLAKPIRLADLRAQVSPPASASP